MRPILRLLLTVVLSATSALVVIGATTDSAYAVDHDCSDFSTQKQAQDYFLAHDPRHDPERLDSDGDLIACETLPCPCSTSTTSTTTQTAGTTTTQRGRVTHIVDGDTLDVRLLSGRIKRIRMLGIDTPEEYNGPVECGAYAAAHSLSRLVPVGTAVRLVSDPTQDNVDRYGRLLRYVVRSRDSRDIDRAQVWRGMARVYVYAQHPFQRYRSYAAAQADARTHDRGSWRTCW